MNRKSFITLAAGAAGASALGSWKAAFAAGSKNEAVGRAWRGWKPGEFQVHFIYTGVAESMFIIFPDSTTMLLDCGDHAAVARLDLAVPVLPNPGRLAGDWVGRYVRRVNPNGDKVDYMVTSHFHQDHYTAGDLSSPPEFPEVEKAIGAAAGKVDVAKINHHGHHSMPFECVRDLAARVYVACTWDQLHVTDDTMTRLSDRTACPDDRLNCPGVMPARSCGDTGASSRCTGRST